MYVVESIDADLWVHPFRPPPSFLRTVLVSPDVNPYPSWCFGNGMVKLFRSQDILLLHRLCSVERAIAIL